MKYSVLGSTGVKVSRICLGTATFGVAPTAQDADRLVGAASTSASTSSTPPTCTATCRSSTGPAPRPPPTVNPPSRSSAAPSAAAATRW